MKNILLILITSLFIQTSLAMADSNAVSNLLEQYQTLGAGKGNAERGQQLWITVFEGKGEFKQRSCTSCHGENLSKTGKHVKTGKIIHPMSPGVNPERLAKVTKIEKWFKRNCKWTLGRECTVQEKTDFLLFLGKPVIF